MDTIEKAAREYRELKRIREELDDELNALADTIKAAMGAAEQMVAGEYKISNRTVTSARIDTSAIKRDLPDIASRYTVTTTAKRFTVA